MRAAPAVSIEPAGSPGAWLWALRGLLALAVGAALAWAAARPGLSGLFVAVVVLVYALGLAWHTRRLPRWRLDWDGSAWQLCGAPDGRGLAAQPRPADVAVALDFGSALLLRVSMVGATTSSRWWTSGQAPVWLPLQRRDHAARWHALRCALHSARRQP